MKKHFRKYIPIFSLSLVFLSSSFSYGWVNGKPPAPIDFHFHVNDRVYESWSNRFCDGDESCVDSLMECAFGESNEFTCVEDEHNGFTCGCNIHQIFEACQDQL